MRDALGNKIREGSLVLWRAYNLPCRVVSVTDGGLSVGPNLSLAATEVTAGKIVLQIELPIGTRPDLRPAPGAETKVDEFICLVDPDVVKKPEPTLQ